ncbi:MAG: efflux RND transporter periplasmic adaptor subunit [Gammaproteobacteria bacterium]|jgi:RND family efflux transporter MFP subunit|uniref:Efflux RND transporter periplasmic adaptor subunit n=1 Tax=SAR86 cluster bacterium TaxID=2030880 RepID=A0A368C8T4_9GAMM|nr:MAG: efflux RND transporter periplasmic adaptor subunit [SAR86 cluster bacterium]|tara:strand:- start:8806 stop:9783 length:978 start_codon:yes stop_codon:yes gene_type:complete
MNKKLKYLFFLVLSVQINTEPLSLEILEVSIIDSYKVKKQLPGKLFPVQQSKVSFQIGGKIQNIYVDIGDKVLKDDILAELDNREITANLNQAKAKYQLASQLLDRFKDLKAQGHISIQELDKAESDFLVAQSQYDFYKVKLEQTKILAPFNGLIQSRYLDEGSVINPGLPILEIIDSEKVEAHVALPLYLIDKISMQESFTFNLNGESINGVLKRLSPMSLGGSNNRLAIFEFNTFFVPGAVINLELEINEIERGTWIPIKALSQSDGGLWSVYIVNKNNSISKELVEVIYYEGKNVYVSGTLSDGDLVIKGGATKVIEGQLIN